MMPDQGTTVAVLGLRDTGLLSSLFLQGKGYRVFASDLSDQTEVRDSVAKLKARGIDAEISLDHAMCCGVGACFACVVKRRAANDDGWEYVRTCVDGPVFRASDTVWDT